MVKVLSKIVSGILSPFIIPTYIYITLIFSSYLAMLPASSILIFLGIIAFFTALVPSISIAWNRQNIEKYSNNRSLYPYFITGICYMFLAYIFVKTGLPLWFTSFLFSGIVLLIMLAILKKSFKVSVHMTAYGAYLGAIFAIAKFQGNIPIDIISMVILLGGILGSSRAYLKDYTPGSIITGAVLGFVWSYYMAIFIKILF